MNVLKLVCELWSRLTAGVLTWFSVLHGSPDPAVKGPGVCWALEGQAELHAADPPVVEDGIDLIIHQIPPDDAVQQHLETTQQHFTAWATKHMP